MVFSFLGYVSAWPVRYNPHSNQITDHHTRVSRIDQTVYRKRYRNYRLGVSKTPFTDCSNLGVYSCRLLWAQSHQRRMFWASQDRRVRRRSKIIHGTRKKADQMIRLKAVWQSRYWVRLKRSRLRFRWTRRGRGQSSMQQQTGRLVFLLNFS